MMATANYKAGAARVRFTPEESLWLAGYASRTAPARGTISDLYARALALEDQLGQRFVIVSADIIAITQTISDQVAAAVCEKHGLKRSHLLLAATHTHYAPEIRPEKALFFHIPDDYALKIPSAAEKLVAAIVEAIDQAFASLEPVQLFVRQTQAGFARNRRRHGVKEGRPSTEDVVDHDVPVLDCVDETGRRKAIVFGYACHNLTIPPEDSRYCADWAGFACDELRAGNDGATVLFIAGAGADQDPEPRGSLELARQYGSELADAIRHSLDTPGTQVTGPIKVAVEEVELSLEPVCREQLKEWLAGDDPPKRVKAKFLLEKLDRDEKLMTSLSAPIQVVQFGSDLTLVAFSGEPVVDWARKIKQGAGSGERGVRNNLLGSPLHAPRSPLVWVAGYCNDMFGYLPTRRLQLEGGYEGGRAALWSEVPAPFTEDVEDRVTEVVERLIHAVDIG